MSASEVLEWTGFVSGILCVWWVVRERIANWPIGIVNCLAWLILLWMNAIYLNAILQLVYITISVYGWWHWLYGGPARDALPVRCALTSERMWGLLVIAAGTLLGARLMWLAGDAAPVWDSLTTITSIVAIYWQAKKIYESWMLWLTVDVVYFGLYGSQRLWLTALTQVAFGMMCVMGLRDWRRSMAGETVAA
jgi:nicotinamide mononucleotide transporter